MSSKMLKLKVNFFGFQRMPEKSALFKCSPSLKIQVAGFNYYYPKEPVDTSEWPANRKLVVIPKQPDFGNVKPPKMYKMIQLMRGPERVHNQLLYKGYGVKALLGGRMKYEHFESVRMKINKKLNTDRMFALWRIDAPWQPLSKRGIGKTLGGGKGAIHHYCTPVKADRIIVELGGDVHRIEAIKILGPVAATLPFPARIVSQQDLEKEKENAEWVEKNNKNPYPIEYVIRNNMGGCHKFLSKYDHEWFCKYR